MFAIAAAGSLAAEELFVEYVEGFIDVRSGGSWQELYIGDSVSETDTVKLDDNSLAEFSGLSKTFTLTKPGTYEIRSLLTASRRKEQSGMGTLLSGKMQSMFGPAGDLGPSTVGGVRASEAVSEENEFMWVESDVQELIISGKELLEQEEYGEALELFEEAYDYALDLEEEYASLFYQAYTQAILERPGAAMDVIADIDPAPEAEYYYDFYLLKGKLLIDFFAFEEAAEFLTTFDEIYATPEQKQTLYLLTGYSYLEAELLDRAKEYLQGAVAIDPDSDTGKTASELFEEIST
jgi:tetratricopeptide (TPR) repeat protein